MQESIAVSTINNQPKCPFSSYDSGSYNNLISGSSQGMKCDTSPCINMGYHSSIHQEKLISDFNPNYPSRSERFLVTAGNDLQNHFCSHSYIIELTTGTETSKVKGRIYF